MSNGAVLITGAPGSGKSSVAEALGTLLEREEIPYAGIETDYLGWGWPWLNLEACLPQLRALVGLERQAGRRFLLVVATTETPSELEAVVGTLDSERVLVVCLSAPGELAASRVAEREPDSWPGKPALVRHARELAGVIPQLPGLDMVISTEGRRATEVAEEIRDRLSRG